MTQRRSVTRWFGVFGVTLALVGLIDPGMASAQTLAETRQKAGQGAAAAQFNLGGMYATGRGAPQDDAQAFAWYRKAADQGRTTAQFNLGGMYATGRGVPLDYVESLKWSNLAVIRATGDTQNQYAASRDALAMLMTPAQIFEAQQRAAEWQADFEKRQAE